MLNYLKQCKMKKFALFLSIGFLLTACVSIDERAVKKHESTPTMLLRSTASHFNAPLGRTVIFDDSYLGRYFHSYSNMPLEDFKPVTDFSDKFMQYLDDNFIKINNNINLSLVLFQDYQAFHSFYKEYYITKPPKFGSYSAAERAVFFNTKSGIGTGATRRPLLIKLPSPAKYPRHWQYAMDKVVCSPGEFGTA